MNTEISPSPGFRTQAKDIDHPRALRIWLGEWLLGLALVVAAFLVSMVARQLGGTVSTFLPFFFIVALVALAIRAGPLVVGFNGAICAGGFLYFLFSTGEEVGPLAFARSATILLAAGLASRISAMRRRAERDFSQISGALLQLPLGVILSDAEGTIRFVNEEACRKLDTGREDLVGRSFFSIFAVPEVGGAFGVDYESLMTAPSNQPTRVTLTPRGSSLRALTATITPLQTSGHKILLTSLLNV